MVFWRTFLESIKLPQKKAVFSLNRIGMDITVLYMFFMLAIASIPSLIEQVKNNSTATLHVSTLFFFIFFFIFYYLILIVIVFILISIIAYIGTKIAQLIYRRLRFSILWKMTAFSTTLPIFIFTIVTLMSVIPNNAIWFFLLYIFIILIKIITIYPRIKK